MGSDIKHCKKCGKQYNKKTLLGRVFEIPSCSCIDYAKDERDEMINELIIQSGIPEKFRKKTLHDWISVPGTEGMVQATREYLSNMEDNIRAGRGMLFAGLKGTGKTKMQCYLGMKIICNLGRLVRYISLTKFLSTIEKMKKNRENYADFVERYINTRILIIDDVGESKVDDWKRDNLFLLFDGRNNRNCVTFINTMRDYDTQCEYIGEHIVSRIQEMTSGNYVEISSQVDMRDSKNMEIFTKK